MISREDFDKIIKDNIGQNGVFVEIGAYDGETLSNTCHLADNGWEGHYYEPIKEYANKCSVRHKDNNVKVYNFGIGKLGKVIMGKSGMLSTVKDKNYQDKVSKLPWFKDTYFEAIEVDMKDVSVIPECDLLVIDTEGSEYDIITELRIRPKVLMIELHEQSGEWQDIINTKSLTKIIEDMGYSKIYFDDVDTIFVKI
ncbi:MAG: FkbM family methyltransferase [Minisyncoccia bacterium]